MIINFLHERPDKYEKEEQNTKNQKEIFIKISFKNGRFK